MIYLSKKVGSTARYGPRYGRKIRLNVKKIEEKAKATYDCPKCSKKGVKRISTAIWKCKKCGVKFAGGAHRFENRSQKLISAAIAKKEAAESE